MATYYVRPDGNNSNTGTGPATNQAWQTVTYALANMVLTNGANYLYIAPGAYREAPTVTITPSSTQTLVISGDPTASQFSGLTAGAVRLTNFTSDTANPSNANILTISGKTYITIENIYFDMYNTNSFNYCILGASNPNFITVQKCAFIGQDNGAYHVNAIQLSTSTTINVTIDKCIFVRTYVGFWLVSTATAGTSQNVAITRSLFLNPDIAGIYMTGNGIGRTVYNCTFAYSDRGCVGLDNAEASSTGVYNCLFYAGTGTALGTNGVGIVENYNRFVAINPRNNVSPSGANSTSGGVAGLDFGYGLLTGMANQQMFSTLLNSPNFNFGTTSGAPVSDMYGVTWTGANPDAGSATYKSLSAIGAYLPTERNASTITIAPGETSRSLYLYLGATGLTHTTTNLTASYTRNGQASVPITLVAQTPTGSYVSGGFCEVSAPYARGTYRLDVPNAAFDFGADDVTIFVGGANTTNGAVLTCNMQGIAGNIVHIGPFKVIGDGLGSDQPLDIVQGVQAPVSVQLVDANENGVDISGATVEAKVYNAIGSLIATYSCVPVYAADGRCTFQLSTGVTNTAGVYNVTLTRTIGGNIVVFGPMKMIVRAN